MSEKNFIFLKITKRLSQKVLYLPKLIQIGEEMLKRQKNEFLFWWDNISNIRYASHKNQSKI